MNLLPLLENGLFALGQVLRFPVMALLWVCVAASIFMAGSCLVELVARKRERAGFHLDKWMKGGNVLNASADRVRQLPSPLRQLVAAVEQGRTDHGLEAGGLENLVLEREERVRKVLGGPRLLVKIGPSLGLLGTLIPMGQSLASLAAGNLEAMAGQMIVAFTTTIIGLATGTLAFLIATVRLSWVNETVREQRYLAEKILVELSEERPREYAGRK